MPADLPLVWTITKLAKIVELDERTVTRWLESNKVPIRSIGRSRVVWLSDLAANLPEFSKSLAVAAASKRI